MRPPRPSSSAASRWARATPETRAQRRALELAGRGEEVDYAAILEDVKKRDARDSERAAAPLVESGDTLIVDGVPYRATVLGNYSDPVKLSAVA